MAGERLHGAEVLFPVGLGLAGSGGEVGTKIEAFPVGGRRGEESEEGEESGESFHDC